MATVRLFKVDVSNIADHHYLSLADECYYFHEYTARMGFAHSPGNDLISNLKKPVSRRGMAEYQYKERAVEQAANLLAAVFRQVPAIMAQATVVAVPPSRQRDDPDYDDRMEQIVSKATAGLLARVAPLIVQQGSYAPSHLQATGQRIRPDELRAMYRVSTDAPRPTVLLVDDMLTSGAHFVACRDAVVTAYPGTRVIGFFIARRATPAADAGDGG